jgi:hypothetical protein
VAGKAFDVTTDWKAGHPPRLRGKALSRYRTLRNAIMKTVATEIGGTILMVDAEPGGSLLTTLIHPEPAA